MKLIIDAEDNFIRQTRDHTHAPDPDSIYVERLRSGIKRTARETHDAANNVIAANIVVAGEAVLAKIPKMETIRRDVRRQRTVLAAYSPIPDDTLFHIPNPYSLTTTGEQFLQFDNGRHDRILIFGSTESFNFLERSEHWFMDGTFATVPEQFAQLYTVHSLHRGRNVVGAYGLSWNKRIETYIELLTQIQTLTNKVNPGSVLIDFEQSVISAMDRFYPIVPQ